MGKRLRLIPLRPYFIFILLVVAMTSGCGLAGSPSTTLNVPYRQQVTGYYCGPASILMWRLYDRLPEISQATIANYIGCSTSGSSPSDIVRGVNYFTFTRDAYWDIPGGQGDPDEVRAQFFSRQITSIEQRVPVIAIVEGGLHAGVVNGGKWHDTTTGQKMWDYVYFHDPDPQFGGPNVYWSADFWTNDYVSHQVISSNAVLGASANYSSYGYDVTIRGRDWPLDRPLYY